MSTFPPDELAARRNRSGRNAPYRWTTAQDSRPAAHAYAFVPMSVGYECRHAAPNCFCARPLTRRERLALWFHDNRDALVPMAIGLALGFGLVLAVYMVR